ncbi:MAG: hypothetical protein VCA36_11530 [Opitutales bacterium]
MGSGSIAIDCKGNLKDNFCMRKILLSMIAGPCLALGSGLYAAEPITVAGFSFRPQAGWVNSGNSKFQIRADNGQVVIIDIQRRSGPVAKAQLNWGAMFPGSPAPSSSSGSVNNTKVTYLQFKGTYVPKENIAGLRPKNPGYSLYGAIIEGKAGTIWVKMTGPVATVNQNVGKLKAMVTGALR